MLEAIQFPVGRQRLTLWDLLVGAVSVVLTLLAALWIGSVIEARLMAATSLTPNSRVVVSRLLKALLAFVAVLVALSLVGIDLTVLSVFGGALGVGLGLGLQRIASNYVSGFIILLDNSLTIGDMITVDKYYGAVSQINTRYTVIKALDGTETIVPNEMLVSSPVINHSYSDRKVRVAVKVSVAYRVRHGPRAAGAGRCRPRAAPRSDRPSAGRFHHGIRRGRDRPRGRLLDSRSGGGYAGGPLRHRPPAAAAIQGREDRNPVPAEGYPHHWNFPGTRHG